VRTAKPRIGVSRSETPKPLENRRLTPAANPHSPNHTTPCRPSTYACIPSRQYLLMNQEKGRIEDVARKKAKNGTPYASVRIDGENYTCWDDALISKLDTGQDVDYQWEQSGKFKKIIDIEPVLDEPS